jgi:D-aminopeptidase
VLPRTTVQLTSVSAAPGGRPDHRSSVRAMDAARSLRALGLRIGELEPGPTGSIADVAGVGVGHVTVVRDEPDPPAGRGVARTGVTAVVPAAPETLRRRPLPAGIAVLNGAGEMTGSLQVAEWGVIETPIYLTATMAVGRVFDGAVAAAVAADPAIGIEHVVIPIVGECDDSWLGEARVVQVQAADAAAALADAAREGVVEGAVGAGTGMTCFDFKGGIGTSSRVAAGATVGVLVLTNFGSRRQLRIDGVPVGRLLVGAPRDPRPRPAGSCIVVVATDALLRAEQLERIARRAGLGLARTGSVAHHGSGEIFIAFSTAGDARALSDGELDPLFTATVDATEEAVLNALWSAERVAGREGRVAEPLPHDEVVALLRAHRRL